MLRGAPTRVKKNTGYVVCIGLLAAAFAPSPGQAAPTWWGGTYPLPDGQHVTLSISTRYPQVDAVAQQWVAFFAGLPHGPEMSLVRVYVAPLEEVGEMCLSAEALGCYGGQRLVTVGESSAGVAATSIAAHEYGHHVAANRNNAPWRAVDWGTKRWATAVGICGRVAAGTAFPGDEGSNYFLNPGEAFAEAYRVLAEGGGAAFAFDWPLVDPGFRPDGAALAAVQADVVQPWTAPTTTTLRGAFFGKSRNWTTSLATPLDGDLRVRVDVVGSGADDLAILSPDGRRVLARGTWQSGGGKAAEYRVCGARTLRLRVVRGGAARRFVLRVTKP